jgi:hypothetical protein
LKHPVLDIRTGLSRFTVCDGDNDLGARIVYGSVELAETAYCRIHQRGDFLLDTRRHAPRWRCHPLE